MQVSARIFGLFRNTIVYVDDSSSSGITHEDDADNSNMAIAESSENGIGESHTAVHSRKSEDPLHCICSKIMDTLVSRREQYVESLNVANEQNPR